MELRKIIIHEIRKESGLQETQIFLSEELTPNDNDSLGLVSALLDSYKSDRKVLYAVFDFSEGNYFPERYTRYRESEKTDIDFINFTISTMRNLNPIIRSKTLAKGGYFLFAEYINNNASFLAIFLIRDTEGKILNRTDNSYSIQTIEYLDTNNLAMACKINESRIINNAPNYLTFTQLKQKDVSDYFLDWISIQQPESSDEYTKALYNLVNIIEPPINAETNQEYPIEEFRNLIYNYISSNPNKIVNLLDLGRHFYNDPNKFINLAEENDISIDSEFKYSKRQLRKFVRIEVNRDGINLKFSRGAFNSNKVRFSTENDNIVIIESARFAEALRNELENN